MKVGKVTVDSEHDGERLDRFLATAIDELSRSRVRQLVEAGDVRIDGELARKPSLSVAGGQQIEVQLRRRPRTDAAEAEDLPLRVIHADATLAVIDKAAGMVVHPAPGNYSGTLVNAVLHHFGDRIAGFSDAARPGIVHRLDKGTSGVIVVAFDDATHAALQAQFARRTVAKEYLALLFGRTASTSGTIDVPIGRDRVDRKRISANAPRTRQATTDWELRERLPGVSWVRARPRTGRTHQGRAHFTHIGHPLVGDTLYCGRRAKGVPDPELRAAVAGFGRPALHAAALEFDHPTSGERVRFEAPVAPDLEEILALARGIAER